MQPSVDDAEAVETNWALGGLLARARHQRRCRAVDPAALFRAIGDGYAEVDPVAAAEALRRERRLRIGRFPEQVFSGSLWDAGDPFDRTWQWALHSWQPFDTPIKAYLETGAEGVLQLMERLCAEWEDGFFARRPQEAEFPWHDHATANRLERICRLRLVLRLRTADTPEFAERLARLAATHMEMLAAEDFYKARTNHGHDQAIAQLIGAHVFFDHPAAARWADLALTRLRAEVDFAFTSEGVHVENSPGYHAGMIDNIARTERIVQALGREDAISLRPVIDGAVEFMAFMLRPDRRLPCLGDTILRRPDPDRASLAAAATLPALRYAVSRGRARRRARGDVEDLLRGGLRHPPLRLGPLGDADPSHPALRPAQRLSPPRRRPLGLALRPRRGLADRFRNVQSPVRRSGAHLHALRAGPQCALRPRRQNPAPARS